MQSGFLFFAKNLVVCCYHIAKSVGNFNSVRPIVRIVFAWRSRDSRASAYFAVGVFGKMSELIVLSSWFIWSRCCWSMRGRRNCRRCVPRQPERHLSNLTIPLLILPWMVEATLASLFPHVARGRPQLASAASGRPELCGCRFYSRCVSILEKIWWLAWTPFTRETFLLAHFFRAEVSRVILSIIELQQKCPNHRHFLLLFFCRTGRTVCSHNNWWILWSLNRFLPFWCQLTLIHYLKWSSWVSNEVSLSSRSSHMMWRNIACETRFEEPLSILRLWTWNIVHVHVPCPNWCPCHVFHAQGPFDRSSLECWSIWFSLILRSGLGDS